MADKHPYTSGSGGLVQAVNQLRNSFPSQVTADTLKKLGIAPNNETYIINILRFIEVIDDEGKKSSMAGGVFSKHDDSEFQPAFAELVETAYKELFSLHGQKAWELAPEKLISFFRNADQTSAIVGQRQATTFQTLAKLSGHGETPAVKTSKATGTKGKAPVQKQKEGASPLDKNDGVHSKANIGSKGVGLTVRIEINLPVAADQETYDKIFKSIRENLLSGQS